MRRIRLKTEGVNWAGIFGLVTAVLVVLLGTWLWRDQISLTPRLISDQVRQRFATTSPQVPTSTDFISPMATGIYRPYSPEHLAQIQAESRIVLFFTADNCARCTVTDVRLLEERSQIPEDVVIYTVAYNDAIDLRRRYNVTTPHTFVQIDTLGKLIQQWRGSMDVASILSRLQ